MNDALRELQLCELDILREIKRVCERNGIRFFLASGTLLGAARHQGFIPWDDDIDVEMPYEDYLRFQEIAQDEMGEGFFIQSSDTDPNYQFPYLRVQKCGTALVREWETDLPGNHRVWVDVFPLVDLGGKTDFRVKRLAIRIASFLRMDSVYFEKNEKWYKEQSNAVLFWIVKMARLLPQKARWSLAKRLLCYFVFRQADTPDKTFVWTTVTRRLPRRIYEEPEASLWFEDDYYPAPKGYEEYLRILYKDYMQYPPEEKRLPAFTLLVNFEREWKGADGSQPDFEWNVIPGQR